MGGGTQQRLCLGGFPRRSELISGGKEGALRREDPEPVPRESDTPSAPDNRAEKTS